MASVREAWGVWSAGRFGGCDISRAIAAAKHTSVKKIVDDTTARTAVKKPGNAVPEDFVGDSIASQLLPCCTPERSWRPATRGWNPAFPQRLIATEKSPASRQRNANATKLVPKRGRCKR